MATRLRSHRHLLRRGCGSGIGHHGWRPEFCSEADGPLRSHDRVAPIVLVEVARLDAVLLAAPVGGAARLELRGDGSARRWNRSSVNALSAFRRRLGQLCRRFVANAVFRRHEGVSSEFTLSAAGARSSRSRAAAEMQAPRLFTLTLDPRSTGSDWWHEVGACGEPVQPRRPRGIAGAVWMSLDQIHSGSRGATSKVRFTMARPLFSSA